MTIEHLNGSAPQPVAEPTHSEPLPEFAPTTYNSAHLDRLQAEYRRNRRLTAIGIAAIMVLTVAYFTAAAAAPVSPVADTIAETLAAIIYLVCGWALGYSLRSHRAARRRNRL